MALSILLGAIGSAATSLVLDATLVFALLVDLPKFVKVKPHFKIPRLAKVTTSKIKLNAEFRKAGHRMQLHRDLWLKRHPSRPQTEISIPEKDLKNTSMKSENLF